MMSEVRGALLDQIARDVRDVCERFIGQQPRLATPLHTMIPSSWKTLRWYISKNSLSLDVMLSNETTYTVTRVGGDLYCFTPPFVVGRLSRDLLGEHS